MQFDRGSTGFRVPTKSKLSGPYPAATAFVRTVSPKCPALPQLSM